MGDIRLPWDFGTPTDDPTKNANVPTPEGAALGRELARIADVEANRRPDVHPRCDECAFRLGTVPNQCLGTLADALKCALEGDEPFYCHKGITSETGAPLPGDREPLRLCRGYMLMRAARAGKAG